MIVEVGLFEGGELEEPIEEEKFDKEAYEEWTEFVLSAKQKFSVSGWGVVTQLVIATWALKEKLTRDLLLQASKPVVRAKMAEVVNSVLDSDNLDSLLIKALLLQQIEEHPLPTGHNITVSRNILRNILEIIHAPDGDYILRNKQEMIHVPHCDWK